MHSPTFAQPESVILGSSGLWTSQPNSATERKSLRGLECLADLDQVFCYQFMDVREVVTGQEMCNRYSIKNNKGVQIYLALEESDSCQRECCGSTRGFTLTLLDGDDHEIIKIVRPFRLCAGFTWCPLFSNTEATIESPPGVVIGQVKQICSLCTVQLDICDAHGDIPLHINGRFNGLKCCQDIEFPIMSKTTGLQIGAVTRHWSGPMQEMYTNADKFGVTFPRELDIKLKAVLLGATFLIDFLAFEEHQGSTHY